MVLANIAEDGQTGGCPSEYLELRWFAPSEMPTSYCDIPGHQIDYGPVSVPYNLSVSSGGSYINLSWQDSNTGVTFVVERRIDGGSSSTFSNPGTSLEDYDVTTGHTYSYRVYAYRAIDGESSTWSSWVNIAY